MLENICDHNITLLILLGETTDFFLSSGTGSECRAPVGIKYQFRNVQPGKRVVLCPNAQILKVFFLGPQCYRPHSASAMSSCFHFFFFSVVWECCTEERKGQRGHAKSFQELGSHATLFINKSVMQAGGMTPECAIHQGHHFARY